MLAFVAWFWVQSQEVATAPVRVNLSYRMPEDLVNVDPLLNSATVIVQGPRGSVRLAQRQRPTLVVDLRDAEQGLHEIPLDSLAMENLPPGLEQMAFSPETVVVRLDQKVRRNVAVRGRWMGQPDPDHEVVGMKPVPDVVEVAGPRAVIEGIEAIETAPVDVTGWDETRRVPVELDLPRGVRTTRPWQGEAVVELRALTTVRQLAQVPVVVPDPDWRPEAGSETIPVALTGPTDVLRALRPDQVLARVELPPNPKESRYTARWRSEHPPRLVILVPREDVVEVATAPPAVEVVRR